MSSLNCHSTNCANNRLGRCVASNVNICGENAHKYNETYCNNYNSSRASHAIKSMESINFGNVMQNYYNENYSIHNTAVHCNANNCYHNSNGVCNAANIRVNNGRETVNGANCSTFIESFS